MTKPAPFKARLLGAFGERKVTYELVSNTGLSIKDTNDRKQALDVHHKSALFYAVP
jgi:hypothetical protein